MDEILLWAFLLFGLMVAAIILTTVWDLKKNKEKYKKAAEEYENKRFSEEGESIQFHATIVDMVCGTGMVGSYRLPKSEKTFLIVFKDDSGEITELRVGEDVYTSLDVGMCGTLTILNGHLDSFELDGENINESNTTDDNLINKMWDMWAEDKLPSPVADLMLYQAEVNNGGHDQFFFNLENHTENDALDNTMNALRSVLSDNMLKNLEDAYLAYKSYENNEDIAAEKLEKCDMFYYDNEEEIDVILNNLWMEIRF